MASLSALKQQYTNKTGVSNLLTQNQQQTVYTHLQEEDEARKNQGGFFGGIGYAFEKLGLGFLSSIEGIWDYTAGGLAKLFGADEWAEQQFANDWVNYGHADEWFNPSEGWQFVGDVAGGIGTSLPAIATVVAAGAIAVASGGTLSPVAAALISGAVAGLGAAGNATKEAYRQTGELGGKEFGYGALVGITEGAVEGLSAGIGAGTGQIVKGISKSFGKEVAESAARQTIGKTMLKGFIGEAFEEGLSEILDPVWARLTYDPNAKNATLQEVGYAALVGGLSGAIMGGVDVSIRNVHSMSRGNTIVKEGKSSNVISMAEQLSTYESQNHTGYEQFATVDSVLKELQTSMKKTNGDIKTAKVDLTCADDLALFHKAHPFSTDKMKGKTQSNYYYGELTGSASTLEDALGVLSNKVRNFKDENGDVMEYVADTLIIPCNRPHLETLVKKVVGSERTVGSANNDINTQYGNWTIVVLNGWEANDDRFMVMSSDANKNLLGNMFYNRVPLDITNDIDKHTRNYFWNGYCRFGVGFNTWKHILLAVNSKDAISAGTKL